MSIKADIVEVLQRKLRQDRAVCPGRDTVEGSDELDAVTRPELLLRLCHTP